MSDPVYCDHCRKPGYRPRMYPAPRDWLFLEAKDDADDTPGQEIIVFACSPECAVALWKIGPGPRFAAEEVMGA